MEQLVTNFLVLNLSLVVTVAIFVILNKTSLSFSYLGTPKDLVLTEVAIVLWCISLQFADLFSFDSTTKYSFEIKATYFLLLFIVHDVYVYTSHRVLHTKYLYRRIHLLHHKNRLQTPLTAWSVHPVEALIDSAAAIFLALLIPAPKETLTIYINFIFTMNLLGHLSLELSPFKLTRAFMYRLRNFHHHNIHHEQPKVNFGALSLWDRILSTRNSLYRSHRRGKSAAEI